jgi:glycosyltransferase involved in cell wall biosynthesis
VILGVNGIRLVAARSGVARAIEAILACLGEIEHPFREIRVYTPSPLDAAVVLPPCAHNVVLPSRLPPGLWEQVVLPCAHGNRDLLFCPSYVVPVFARCPTVLVHHGSYEGYPHVAEVFSRWVRIKARISYPLSAHRATAVSTVSAFSRQDMSRFYRIPAHRIHVIPEGVDTRLFRPLGPDASLPAWRERVLGHDVPYILYVGKPTKRRNLPNLLRAFAGLKYDRGLPHKLLLVGTALPGTSFDSLIAAQGLEQDVVQIGHASHHELVRAYNAADLMVYPSSYEGFGMPVLEAMACGTPVVALDNTAFPEFANDVACLLPDAEVATLETAIASLLADPVRRLRMASDGPVRAAAYDWRIVTRKYLDLMLSVVDARPLGASMPNRDNAMNDPLAGNGGRNA